MSTLPTASGAIKARALTAGNSKNTSAVLGHWLPRKGHLSRRLVVWLSLLVVQSKLAQATAAAADAATSGGDQASNVQPNEICLLTDHEAIPRGGCTAMARQLAHAYEASGGLSADLASGAPVDPFVKLPSGASIPSGARLDRLMRKLIQQPAFGSQNANYSAPLYNRLVPCLNRHYACAQGYNFFMPSSPWLTVLQAQNATIQDSSTNKDKSGSSSDSNSSSRSNGSDTRAQLKAISQACVDRGAVLNKKDDSLRRDGQRSNTWCKVVLLEEMSKRFPGCKVLVFLDADLLLMPPNAKFYNYPKLKRTLKKRRRLLARNSTDKSTGPLDYCTGVNSLECGRRRTNTETNNQLSLNAPKAPRPPLHRQPEFLAFLANPRATLLTSMAPPGVHKVPRKVGNNLNNTVHSTSFMLLKTQHRDTSRLLRDWWTSVSTLVPAPKVGMGSTLGTSMIKNRHRGVLGESLTIYRTAWAHEQRVLDDYLAPLHPNWIVRASKVKNYNTWGGAYAQHYFWKEEHARSYFAVALDAWIHPLEYFDSSTAKLAAGRVRATCGVVIDTVMSQPINNLKTTSGGIRVQEEGSSSSGTSKSSNDGSGGVTSRSFTNVTPITSNDAVYEDADGVDRTSGLKANYNTASADRTDYSKDEVLSSSTSSGSAPALLFGVLVLANENTLPMLRNALCHPRGWMATGFEPVDVIVAGDFEPSALFSGRSSSSSTSASAAAGAADASASISPPHCTEHVRRRVTFVLVPLPSNYFNSLSTVHTFLQNSNQSAAASAANATGAGAGSSTGAGTSSIGAVKLLGMKKWPYLMVIQPFTLLRPERLTAFLQASLLDSQLRSVMQSPAYIAGHICDAVSDLSSMGLFPRPAHEYGMLFSWAAFQYVAKPRGGDLLCAQSSDFRSVDSGVALLSSCAFPQRLSFPPATFQKVAHLHETFAPWHRMHQPLSPALAARFITLGPFSNAADMMAANEMANAAEATRSSSSGDSGDGAKKIERAMVDTFQHNSKSSAEDNLRSINQAKRRLFNIEGSSSSSSSSASSGSVNGSNNSNDRRRRLLSEQNLDRASFTPSSSAVQSKPSSAGSIVFAVLVRESVAMDTIVDTLTTWSHSSSVLFFVDMNTFDYLEEDLTILADKGSFSKQHGALAKDVRAVRKQFALKHVRHSVRTMQRESTLASVVRTNKNQIISKAGTRFQEVEAKLKKSLKNSTINHNKLASGRRLLAEPSFPPPDFFDRLHSGDGDSSGTDINNYSSSAMSTIDDVSIIDDVSQDRGPRRTWLWQKTARSAGKENDASAALAPATRSAAEATAVMLPSALHRSVPRGLEKMALECWRQGLAAEKVRGKFHDATATTGNGGRGNTLPTHGSNGLMRWLGAALGFSQVSGTESGTSIDKKGVAFVTFQSCLAAAADADADAVSDTARTTSNDGATSSSETAVSLSTSAKSKESTNTYSRSIAGAAASGAAIRAAAALNKFKVEKRGKGGEGGGIYEDPEDEALSAAWQVFTKYPGTVVKSTTGNSKLPSTPTTPSSFSSPHSSPRKAKAISFSSSSRGWQPGAAAALGVSTATKKEEHTNTARNTVPNELHVVKNDREEQEPFRNVQQQQQQEVLQSRLQSQLPTGMAVFNDWGDDDVIINKNRGPAAASPTSVSSLPSPPREVSPLSQRRSHLTSEKNTAASAAAEESSTREETGQLEWDAAQPAKKYAFKLSVPLVPYYEGTNEWKSRQEEQSRGETGKETGPGAAPAAGDYLNPPVLRRTVRVVGLELPSMPRSSSSTFYKRTLRKDRQWDYWLRKKVAAIVSFFEQGGWPMKMQPPQWVIMVDDDTYIRPHLVSQWLQHTWLGRSHEPLAMGREFTRVTKKGTFPEKLIGGGPGIVLSWGALTAMSAAQCTNKTFPVISDAVPGGDGWLGQCCAVAKVKLLHDWRFKSLPPVAYPRDMLPHMFSFHKVHASSLRSVHAYLTSLDSASTVPLSPASASRDGSATASVNLGNEQQAFVNDVTGRNEDKANDHNLNHNHLTNNNKLERVCDPVLPRGASTYECAPSFVILGAQKAATTSLFGYLRQHPQVALPRDKELNFLGYAFPKSTYYPGVESFIFKFLVKFPNTFRHQLGNETNLKGNVNNGASNAPPPAAEKAWLVSGEASPDYLVSGIHAVVNTLRFLPRAKLVVSLRDPIERAISAYHNKLSDGTVHKMLNPIMWGTTRADQRFDQDIPNYKPPTFHELVRRTADSMAFCPQTMHFTMNDKPPSANACLSEQDSHTTTTSAITTSSTTSSTGAINASSSSPSSLFVHSTWQPQQSSADTIERIRRSKGDAFCRYMCYVNPFVLHGAYANYLKVWAHAGASMQVVDYQDLDEQPGLVLKRLCKYLHLDSSFTFDTQLVLNSRLNRGVHAPESKPMVGGTISAISKDALLQQAATHSASANASSSSSSTSSTTSNLLWSSQLTPDATYTLREFYELPNADLQAFLKEIGQPLMKWPQQWAKTAAPIKNVGLHRKPNNRNSFVRRTQGSRDPF